ncbi:LysR family transcriptional regulator [Cupriavidus sp. M-11]|uniref:LysR family transcriptional regulator n=1 Tax=Cupriavidus sp. M-11 TaxID=3233038 RepID=UPI003F8E73C4
MPASAAARQAARTAASLRFDLTTMRLFIATAESGGITRAAEQLCLVPAAASRRIRELEAQLGLPLFERRPHGMALTDAGRAMLAHARSLIHAVDRMQDDAAAFLHGDRGVIRIAACTSAVVQFLPADLGRCHAAWPDIKVDLQELNSVGVIQAVKRGLADVGVYESTVGPVALPSLPYREDRLVLVAHHAHPLAGSRKVAIDDLLAHEVIGLTEGASISITLGRLAVAASRPLRMRIRVGSFDSMIAMIAGEIGIGIMPAHVATMFARGKTFRHIAIDEAWACRRFVLCHQPHAELSSAARALIPVLTAGSAAASSADSPNVNAATAKD